MPKKLQIKKILLIIVIIALCNVAGWFCLESRFNSGQSQIGIAVCLPTQTPEGKMALEGIYLYLAQLKQDNPDLYRKIKIKVYDDQNDPVQASQLANQIGIENNALAVLGHYSNLTSIAAGKIYKRFGIVAVTASASAIDLTRDNEFYFSIIPSDAFEAAVMAAYVKNSNKALHIIRDQARSDHFFGQEFEKIANTLGIPINKKWLFQTEAQRDQIISDLGNVDPVKDIYLLDTNIKDAAKILTALDKDEPFTFIGSKALLDQAFMDQIRQLALVQHKNPDKISDGVLSSSPFVIDIADKKAQRFRQAFVDRFNTNPSWQAACYYDAIRVVTEASAKADLKASDNMLKQRKKLRKALETFNSVSRSIDGITAHIYFDQNGCIERPYTLGKYIHGKFSPAFMQYQEVFVPDKDALEEVLTGKAIWIDQNLLRLKRVVYSGIKVARIDQIDFINSRFQAEFYLWFRYYGQFDDTRIVFPDALTPIDFQKPIWSGIQDEITTNVYHVTATFKNRFDFFDFPFQHYKLVIHFHHQNLYLNDLVYVNDAWGAPATVLQSKTEMGPEAQKVWRIDSISSLHDIISNVSTLGVPDNAKNPAIINYSRFDNEIFISRRNVLSSLTYIWLLWLAILIMGIICRIHPQEIGKNMGLWSLSFAAAMVNHIWLSAYVWVNYVTRIDYIFFLFYAMAIITAYVIILSYRLWRQNKDLYLEIVSKLYKTLYLLYVIGMVVWLAMQIRSLI